MQDRVAELFGEHGSVESLAVDEEFMAHMVERGTYDKHIVSVTEILEVHTLAPQYFYNAGKRAPIIMIGPTLAGRFLSVPIEPTGRIGVWRPVTAFQANAHHRQAYGS